MPLRWREAQWAAAQTAPRHAVPDVRKVAASGGTWSSRQAVHPVGESPMPGERRRAIAYRTRQASRRAFCAAGACVFVVACLGVACGRGSALWTCSFGAASFGWALVAGAAAATGGDFSAASKALNAAVASGSTAAQVFSKLSTSRRTRMRLRGGVDAFVEHRNNAATKALACRFGRKIRAVERVGASDTDRHREQRTDHLDHGHEAHRPRRPRSWIGFNVDGRNIARVPMKWRIAPGDKHGKPRKRISRFHRHANIEEKIGPDWGAIGEFRLRFLTDRYRSAASP